MRTKVPEIGIPEGVEIGAVLLEGGFPAEAEPYLLDALKRRGNANDWTNLAICARNLMRMEEALRCAEKAVELDPNNIPCWHNLAIILEDFGRFAEAEQAYVRALQLNNLVSFVQQGVCYSRMRRGLFLDETTLQLWHVHRWWAIEMPELRRWAGETLHKRRIIVWREGGAGDHIFFLRWLRLLKESGAHVTLYGLRQHRCLLTGHPWIDCWLDADDEFDSAQFDYQIPLFSIPAVTRRWPLPMTAPYLSVPIVPRRQSEEFTVGVCLKAGEKSRTNRLSRTVPAELAQRFEKIGARFVSLQREPLPDFIDPCAEGNANWKATADLIAACDLVISVDTAIAHMAGAMRKNVWTILPLGSDWRWGGHHTWYPTMRLFRNRHVTDFSETMDRVAEALAKQASRREVLCAP